MRASPLTIGSMCALVALLSAAPAARSATTKQGLITQGASCQLSIPTTDTKFRPKATGARNESTSTTSFIICPIAVAPARNTTDSVTDFALFLQSIDGVARSVTCTAVTGAVNNIPQVFSSKTVLTPGNTTGNARLDWDDVDFGGPAGHTISGSIWLTVTCNLPPQTGLSYVTASYVYEIGT